MHVVHGAAEVDEGRFAHGLEEMQAARTAFADRELVAPQAAMAAILEHETAVVLERPAHARAVRRWLAARLGPTGEVALMAAREVAAERRAGPLGARAPPGARRVRADPAPRGRRRGAAPRRR